MNNRNDFHTNDYKKSDLDRNDLSRSDLNRNNSSRSSSGGNSGNKVNYSRETEKIIAGLDRDRPPRLLLHSCCAPCSSHCLEYLREHFDVTVFYYNPNITISEEYEKRLAEEKRLIAAYNRQVEEGNFTGMHSTGAARRIRILEAPYDPEDWFLAVRGLEACPEGGARCAVCFETRLRRTARAAAALKGTPEAFDYFTTTLTISPLKNAQLLNEIGLRLAGEYGVAWLPSDFKKRDGYKRSIELSAAFDLYRQNYCGCVFSRREAQAEQGEA